MKSLLLVETPLGRLGLVADGDYLTELYFAHDPLPPDLPVRETALLIEARAQLLAYFSGRRTAFSLPLAPAGTTFQKRVWQALCEIPYGETVSYKEVARRIGNEKATRAVGRANNRNPLPILIPCHRVIGANGALVGYGGGLAIKEKLLALEKRYLKGKTG
ncbi:MAG: methylated-DNA--[protein]-cysteine S-methyltransferase [Firmicutes bacterium]|nr:methylated-DNA--[protein]-cysteine S-methyltransferase [Bacillota bacterium]